MKRVLITGATGFIGRQCLPLLIERGFEVHAVSSSESLPNDQRGIVEWYRADLLEPGTASQIVQDIQPNYLLHLAWFAKPGEYLESPLNLQWVQASMQMMSAFSESSGEHFVAAGTCFEYDDEYGFCREGRTPLAPKSLYGTCKSALQSMLSAQAERCDVRCAWGRIFFLYGQHEHPNRLVASVIRSLLSGETAKCSPGTQIRDFMHVEDVARAFVALLESDVSGPVNICSGKPIALKDVIECIATELDAHELVQLGALPQRANEPTLLVGDVTRLTEEVGFTPGFDLVEGIAKTIAWWQQNLGLNNYRTNSKYE